MNARKQILLGAVLLVSSIPFFLYGVMNIGGGMEPERTWATLSLVLGSAAALFGFILVIDGRTMAWQMGQKRKVAAHKALSHGMHSAFTTRDAPATPRGRPSDVRAIPGRRDLEQPSTKECPACKKGVYKDARVCRFCGHPFGVTFRLKIYPPADEGQRTRLVGLLAEKLKMPADEVAHLLELGMRFKYDSEEKLAAARKRFESLGCRTEVYEKAGRE